jgi:hypothetical protein
MAALGLFIAVAWLILGKVDDRAREWTADDLLVT